MAVVEGSEPGTLARWPQSMSAEVPGEESQGGCKPRRTCAVMSLIRLMPYMLCLTKENEKINYMVPRCRLDAQDGLAKVLALEDADQALGGVVDAFGEAHLDAQAAVGEPGLDLFLVLLVVGGAEVGAADDEALHGELAGDDEADVLDGVGVAGVVVLADLCGGGSGSGQFASSS